MKMFFVSGIAGAVVEMITKNNFMPLADMATKRSAYLIVLKLSKAVLTVLAHLVVRFDTRAGERSRIVTEALIHIPNHSELVLRKVAANISNTLFGFVSLIFNEYLGLSSFVLRL